MAIPLISPLERARKTMLAVLQNHLATEMTTINSEAADLVLPSNIRWEQMEAIEEPSTMIVEVVASGVSVSEVGRVQYGQGKLTSAVRVEVGCVVKRDRNWNDGQFLDVLDRCAAAVIRAVTLRHSTLDQSDQLIHGAFPTGTVRYEVDAEADPSGRMIRRIVVPFEVRMRESL